VRRIVPHLPASCIHRRTGRSSPAASAPRSHSAVELTQLPLIKIARASRRTPVAKITIFGAVGIEKIHAIVAVGTKTAPRIDITQRRLDNGPMVVKISCFMNDVG